MSDPNTKKSKKRFWFKLTLVLILLIGVGIGIYIYSIYHGAKETVNGKMHQTVTSIDSEKAKLKMEKKEPLNILLLGVDKREGDQGRSDALLVLSLNPELEQMQLVSIPRDTRTEIVGKGFDDKINHAYAFGGVDMTIATVEELLNIELDYYVQMNMEGLLEMVDAIGGITLENELDWYDSSLDFHYAEGPLELNGEQTMGFVRMRYNDPTGDFGRTKRQRQVVQAIIDKGASFAVVGKISDLLNVLGNNMKTNMDFNVMSDLLVNYVNVRKNVESYTMQGSGTTIEGVYYLLVSDDEVEKVHKMIAD